MAVIKFGSLVTSGSGSVGGSTIQPDHSGHIWRNKPLGCKSSTPAQLLIRGYNKTMQAGWRSLSDSDRQLWNSFAQLKPVFNSSGEKHPLSGHSLWMKYQYTYLSLNLPFLTNPDHYNANGYLPQSVTIFDYMPVTPDFDRKALINYVVSWLVFYGYWNLIDILYLLAAHDMSSSYINFKSPGNFTITNLGNVSFTIDRGFIGGAIGKCLDTNFNLLNDGINYTLNDASIAAYVRLNVKDNGAVIGAGEVPAQKYTYIYPRCNYTPDNCIAKLNDQAFNSFLNFDARGFYVDSRPNATETFLYRNKVSYQSSVNSYAIPDSTLGFCSIKKGSGGSFEPSSNQVAAGFAGASFNQAQVDHITDIVNYYMTGIGANVF